MVAIRDLFPDAHLSEDSKDGRLELFKQAYCGDGPFEARLKPRLHAGFSMLVYVPGNCMAAASEVVRSWGGTWEEYGCRPDQPGTSALLTDIWRQSGGLFARIAAWFGGQGGGPPNVVFHNVDLLSNGRNDLDANLEAKNVLFSLIEGVRSGVVIGLADRTSAPLPPALERVFGEHLVVADIPSHRFARVIPRSLGERLVRLTGSGGRPSDSDVVPESAVRLLASRLRWSDPIRAVKIMKHVAGRDSMASILAGIVEMTPTVQFVPAPSERRDAPVPAGLPAKAADELRDGILAAYASWAGLERLDADWERLVRQLPSGAILHGPPGTGKTHLARWIAERLGLPLRVVTAGEIKDPDWGRAERNMHELFAVARRAAPCVVVFDDGDDLLAERSEAAGAVAGGERGIVHAFLQEVDGFRGPLEGVLLVLTTNRFEHVDRAVRARFSSHIRIPYPLFEDTVGALVDAIASDYGCRVAEVRAQLVDHFYGPIRPDATAQVTNPAWRYQADDNLYSPREIREAIRRLIDFGRVESGRPYDVRPKDVERMKRYYDLQVVPRHAGGA